MRDKRERYCCGVFRMQRTRLAKVERRIEEMKAQGWGDFHQRVEETVNEKTRIERWLAHHSHET
jgi:hypothetical protein